MGNVAELGRKNSYANTRAMSLSRVEVINKPKIKYENTYIMNPHERIQVSEIKELATDVLHNVLDGEEKYEMWKSQKLCCTLADEIKRRIKTLECITRHKIIVQVFIGQQKDQNLKITSRALCHQEYDTWCDAVFSNRSLFATAIIHLMYQD